jgi:hypothetical protein
MFDEDSVLLINRCDTLPVEIEVSLTEQLVSFLFAPRLPEMLPREIHSIMGYQERLERTKEWQRRDIPLSIGSIGKVERKENHGQTHRFAPRSCGRSSDND